MPNWFQRKRSRHDPLGRPQDGCAGREEITEAGSAREHSERTLDQVKAQQGEVDRVTSSLRAHRKDNHFADLLGEVFRERKA